MPVIINDLTAEPVETDTRSSQPHDPSSAGPDRSVTLKQIREAIRRDAERRARLRAD